MVTSPKYFYTPTRADRRRARQILANLQPGEPSAVLDDIAAGPLGGVVSFLAGAGLTFLLIAFKDHRRLAIGSPSAHLVTTLGLRLLDVPEEEVILAHVALTRSPLDSDPVTLIDAPDRARWKLQAAERIINGLHERDLEFVLGWQLPQDETYRLDYTLGAVREKVDDQLRWFLSDALGVDIPHPVEAGNRTELDHGRVR